MFLIKLLNYYKNKLLSSYNYSICLLCFNKGLKVSIKYLFSFLLGSKILFGSTGIRAGIYYFI